MSPLSLIDALDYYPLTVSVQATLKEAISLILQSSYDYALVKDGQTARGILTAKDALSMLAQHSGEKTSCIRVADLLHPLEILVNEAELSNPHALLALFHRHHLQYLPVVDVDRHLVGTISEQNVLRSLLTQAEDSRNSLETRLQASDRKLKQLTEALDQAIADRDRLELALQESVEKFNRIFTSAPIGADTIWEASNFDLISSQHRAISQQAETALRESEARLQDIIDNASAIIYLKDLQGRYILINRKFQILFNAIGEEVFGKTDRDIFPENLAKQLWEHHLEVITEDSPREFEETLSQGDEDKTFLSIKFPLHNAAGELYAVCGISTDISDRKKAEKLIATSLGEKEVLLKEIHHRVKNNMHVISNLLDLQTQYIDDVHVIDLFTDSQNRINSMALIHEQLYQSPSLGAISFDCYLRDLVNNLFASYNFNPSFVQLQLDLEPVTVNIETAMPCGLIVNELVSNSLKYAFPQKRSGTIGLQLYTHPDSKKQLKDRRFVLVVSDNGVGIRDDINWQSTNSLGLRLVRMLTRQLEGEVELDLKGGTLFRLVFTELQYRERL